MFGQFSHTEELCIGHSHHRHGDETTECKKFFTHYMVMFLNLFSAQPSHQFIRRGFSDFHIVELADGQRYVSFQRCIDRR